MEGLKKLNAGLDCAAFFRGQVAAGAATSESRKGRRGDTGKRREKKKVTDEEIVPLRLVWR